MTKTAESVRVARVGGEGLLLGHQDLHRQPQLAQGPVGEPAAAAVAQLENRAGGAALGAGGGPVGVDEGGGIGPLDRLADGGDHRGDPVPVRAARGRLQRARPARHPRIAVLEGGDGLGQHRPARLPGCGGQVDRHRLIAGGDVGLQPPGRGSREREAGHDLPAAPADHRPAQQRVSPERERQPGGPADLDGRLLHAGAGGQQVLGHDEDLTCGGGQAESLGDLLEIVPRFQLAEVGPPLPLAHPRLRVQDAAVGFEDAPAQRAAQLAAPDPLGRDLVRAVDVGGAGHPAQIVERVAEQARSLERVRFAVGEHQRGRTRGGRVAPVGGHPPGALGLPGGRGAFPSRLVKAARAPAGSSAVAGTSRASRSRRPRGSSAKSPASSPTGRWAGRVRS